MRAYRTGSNLARVLEFISENPGSGLDDIASGLNIRRYQAANACTRLVRDGFAENVGGHAKPRRMVGRRQRCTSP